MKLSLIAMPLISMVTLSACTNNIIKNAATPYIVTSDNQTAIAQSDDLPPAIKTDVVLPDPNYDSNKDLGIVTNNSINGIWKIVVDNNDVCQISTSHTKYGRNFRASMRACPMPLKNVRSWRVVDGKVNLYNGKGQMVVELGLIKDDQQDGQALQNNYNSLYHKPVILRFAGTLADGRLVTMSRD